MRGFIDFETQPLTACLSWEKQLCGMLDVTRATKEDLPLREIVLDSEWVWTARKLIGKSSCPPCRSLPTTSYVSSQLLLHEVKSDQISKLPITFPDRPRGFCNQPTPEKTPHPVGNYTCPSSSPVPIQMSWHLRNRTQSETLTEPTSFPCL